MRSDAFYQRSVKRCVQGAKGDARTQRWTKAVEAAIVSQQHLPSRGVVRERVLVRGRTLALTILSVNQRLEGGTIASGSVKPNSAKKHRCGAGRRAWIC